MIIVKSLKSLIIVTWRDLIQSTIKQETDP